MQIRRTKRNNVRISKEQFVRTDKGSNFIIEKGSLAVRYMKDGSSDYNLLAKWLANPQVSQFYGEESNLKNVIAKYSPRAKGEDYVTPCIILHRKVPIGYMQYYELTPKDRREYDFDQRNKIYGLDLFIAQMKYRNRGIGTSLLKSTTQYLFRTLQANAIITDPHVENTRAIRVYEKVGFRKIRILPKHEIQQGTSGDCWLMIIHRNLR